MYAMTKRLMQADATASTRAGTSRRPGATPLANPFAAAALKAARQADTRGVVTSCWRVPAGGTHPDSAREPERGDVPATFLTRRRA